MKSEHPWTGALDGLRSKLNAEGEAMTPVENLLHNLTHHLAYPFLPEGFTKIRINKALGRANLRVGDRDVDIDLKTGDIDGAGTGMGPGRKWDIADR